MLIDRIDGYFYEANHVGFEDFEFLVYAANIAGYLESGGKILLDSDMQLTEFILAKYEHWFNEEWKNYTFEEYFKNELIQEFGVKEE